MAAGYEYEWSTIILGEIPAGIASHATTDDYLGWYPWLKGRRPPRELSVNANWRQLRATSEYWSVGPSCPSVSYRGVRCVFPVVAGMTEPIHPLLTWWSVLFALSMLARYEPDVWSAMIDVDSCATATATEHLLDAALDAVPELAIAAIKEAAREEVSRASAPKRST